MSFFAATYDPRILELMFQVLETAGAQARSQNSAFAEDWPVEIKDEWSVMGRAVWDAVARGERDIERLRRRAIDGLHVHRAKVRDEVVASTIGPEHTRPLLIRLRFAGSADADTGSAVAKARASKRKRLTAC